MSNIIHIYKAVKEASQNEALAQAIAEAFDEADSRYPNLANTATQRDLSETELRLMAEIEKTHERIEMTRGEIKATELQIKDVELRLTKEIEAVRLELTKEMGKQTMRTVTYLTAIMGLFYAIVRFVPA
jgi:vacuolar-type H+-ATPase subunit I/STV1